MTEALEKAFPWGAGFVLGKDPSVFQDGWLFLLSARAVRGLFSWF